MARRAPILIDHARQFEHLNRAPIVEAVIQIVGRAEVRQTHGELKAALSSKLPNYPKITSLRSVSVTMPFALPTKPGESSPAERPKQEHSWLGLRLETDDGRNVAMFSRDYFSFSRLKPYQDWPSFQDEALRLWSIHETLAEPSELKRIGVRFINRFEVPPADLDPGEYLNGLEQPPGDLPRSGFFYRDDLAVWGHPYQVTLMRTVQPAAASQANAALLLDLDVYTTQPMSPDRAKLEERLADMRWLKNHMFFENVSEKALGLSR